MAKYRLTFFRNRSNQHSQLMQASQLSYQWHAAMHLLLAYRTTFRRILVTCKLLRNLYYSRYGSSFLAATG